MIPALPLFHRVAGQPIKDLPALATGADELFLAQHPQLLRQRGLHDAEQGLQLADRLLALAQLAQQQQPVRIGQRLHQRAGLAGGAAHCAHVRCFDYGSHDPDVDRSDMIWILLIDSLLFNI